MLLIHGRIDQSCITLLTSFTFFIIILYYYIFFIIFLIFFFFALLHQPSIKVITSPDSFWGICCKIKFKVSPHLEIVPFTLNCRSFHTYWVSNLNEMKCFLPKSYTQLFIKKYEFKIWHYFCYKYVYTWGRELDACLLNSLEKLSLSKVEL